MATPRGGNRAPMPKGPIKSEPAFKNQGGVPREPAFRPQGRIKSEPAFNAPNPPKNNQTQ